METKANKSIAHRRGNKKALLAVLLVIVGLLAVGEIFLFVRVILPHLGSLTKQKPLAVINDVSIEKGITFPELERRIGPPIALIPPPDSDKAPDLQNDNSLNAVFWINGSYYQFYFRRASRDDDLRLHSLHIDGGS
jgi:hypothetical protein